MIVLASSYPLSLRESLSFTSKLCEKPLHFLTVVSGFVTFSYLAAENCWREEVQLPTVPFKTISNVPYWAETAVFLFLGKKKGERERQSPFAPFFSTLQALFSKAHVFPLLTKVSQQEDNICPTTSSLLASLCSLSLPHGKAAELKTSPLFPSAVAGEKSQGGITPCCSLSLNRGYNGIFISRLPGPAHHAPGPVVADFLETSLGNQGAWSPNPYILNHTTTPGAPSELLQRSSRG